MRRSNGTLARAKSATVRWLSGHSITSRSATSGGGVLAGAESTRYLGKWIVLAGLIGVVAGLGALLFSWAIREASAFFLGDLVGYLPPLPVGEGEPVLRSIGRPWMLPVVTTIGGLISGVVVYRFAPEAQGHGTDAAIDAIHHKRGELRARVAPVKLFASAITIGSGGSAGREGPAAQISASFGSLMAGWLRLGPEDRRIAVAAGMGAGIGAIFRAPLGGSLMAAEILYLHDLEVEALIPALIASIVGYSVYGAIDGFEPIFGAQPDLAFSDPVTLLYYAGLGVIAGLGGLLYAKCFYGTEHAFRRLALPVWLKPAIGGLLVGLIGLMIHGAIGTGYGWVQISMTDSLMTLPLWVVLALPFAKIVATSFSIGSGGSGGIFGPGMVIGGMLGAAFWRLGDGVLPHLPASPAPFVIIGMMALFGGIAHAPFAVMLMVAEMTGNLSLLAPAMVAVAIASALVGNNTIYEAQLPDRSASPMHRIRMGFPLLSALTVRDALTPGRPHASGETPDLVEVSPSDSMADALERMAEAGSDGATVTENGLPLGRITNRDVLSTYKTMLQRGVRRAQAMPESSLIVEGRVGASSRMAGKMLSAAELPKGTLIVSIRRGGEVIYPNADTVLKSGDEITAMARPDQVSTLHTLLERRR